MRHRIYSFLRYSWRLLRWSFYELFRLIGGRSFRLGTARGIFNIRDDPEGVSIVLPHQVVQTVQPDSLRMKCGLKQYDRGAWPIFWKKIPHARLVGKSLAYLNSNKKLMSEDVCGIDFYLDDPAYNYIFLPPVTHLPGSWTSIFSRWCLSGHSNYYHWLLDGLPRLALLDHFPAETGILVPTPLKSFQRESLRMLGLLDRCRPTPERHVLVENYYFSSPTMITGCDNPYAIHFLRDRFLQPAPPARPAFEKIYITRKGTSRKPLNEEELTDFLRRNRWTIIQAEDYTFQEQIALFWNARMICSPHGAGLTNLLWCQKGCRVLELCPSNFLNGCFEGLAAYMDLDYRYMIFEADSRYRMKIDLKKFASAIQALNSSSNS
jgi:hypothetical protein